MAKKQENNCNNLKLSKSTLKQATWFVRDHYRKIIKLQELYEQLDGISIKYDGLPKGNGISNPTGNKAIEIASLERDIDIVEKALQDMPDDSRNLLLANIIEGVPFSDYRFNGLGERTWKRRRKTFLNKVAISLNLFIDFDEKEIDEKTISEQRYILIPFNDDIFFIEDGNSYSVKYYFGNKEVVTSIPKNKCQIKRGFSEPKLSTIRYKKCGECKIIYELFVN